jgi:EAL domain-containing protein (putative c-di-GMP-specific phosphodiesterase class I)
VSRGALAVAAPPGHAWLRGTRAWTSGLLARPSERPGLLLASAAAAVGVLSLVQLGNVAGLSWLAERTSVLSSSAAAVLALAFVAHRPGPKILDYRRLATALAAIGLGMVAVELVPEWGGVAIVLANTLIVGGSAISLPVVVPALYRSMDKRARVGSILDSLIMTAAASTFVVTFWRSGGETQAPIDRFLVPALAACLFGSTAMPIIAALSRKIVIRPGGMWAAIAACALLSWCWILWLDGCLHGRPRDEAVSLCYSAGMLVLAWAWVSWTEATSNSRFYPAVAQRLTDILPAASVFVCVAVGAVPHGSIGPLDPSYVGTVVVVVLTIARQRLLVLNERSSSAMLASEVQERAQTMLALSRLESEETLEGTAARICEEAMRLEGIEAASVYAFSPADVVVPLALAGRRPQKESVGEPVDAARTFHLLASSRDGAWVESPLDFAASGASLDPEASRHGRLADGRAEAFAPMHWDDRVVGVVSVSAADPSHLRRLPERLSTVSEFGVVASALMGPLLDRHWEAAHLRTELDELIAQHAFWPVFQSVVRLADRGAVGYEALTRFADGSRPDLRFAQANAAGMSVRFEMACLKAQLEAAAWLPAGAWLSVNVSPALANAVVPLVSALELAERDLVFEITEHVEVGDYSALDRALELVRGRARLAVDDAGAGYAGLRHILELRPQFVKLDLSLVRNVDIDRARQAMVAGMAHFAGNSGCDLIAEGIETEEELAELIRLGVKYGQGYLFGRPEPIG